MKYFIFLIFYFYFTLAWALPDCEGSPVIGDENISKIKNWNNCKGTLNITSGEMEAEWQNGLPNGQGIFIDPIGNKYVGEFKDAYTHGQGTYTYANGDKYVGSFKNDKFDGKGTYTYSNGDKYIGEHKSGMRHGKGIATFSNGGKYEGEYKNNQRNGKGTYMYANGDKYVGEHKNSEYHGKGIYTYSNGSKYIGEYRNYKRNGQGTFIYANGDKYVGTFKNDERHGHGTYTSANGDKYVGEYKNSLKHGQGTTTFTNGESYEGKYKEGKSHGQGTYTYANGNKYIGDHENGLGNGQGMMVLADGIVWKGQWKDDVWVSGEKFAKGEYAGAEIVYKCKGSPSTGEDLSAVKNWDNCLGTLTFSDIGKYSGEWQNGLPNGKGTFIDPKGSQYVGEFKDAERHGQGTYTYANGNKYMGEYKNGKRHGQGTFTFASGDRYVGEFKDNIRHGKGTYIYAEGGKYVGEFKNDRRNGIGTRTFPNGDKYIGGYKNGKYDGLGTYTYADGSVYEGDHKNGFANGQGIMTFADGRVWEGQWKDDNWKSGKKYAKGEYDGAIITTHNKKNTNKNLIEEKKLIQAASGSGFLVSSLGHVVSNNHVIQGCEKIKAHRKGKTFEVRVLASDTINDLALLQINFSPSTFFSISQNNIELLQDVFVAGYPFGESISSSVKVTKGIVSSLVGIGNNYSVMQIDAALQPGNSGGPILDKNGNILGVAVAKLDLGSTMEKFGVVPEGTNFGIKSSILKIFLQSNDIELKKPIKNRISRSELSKKITDGTLFLSCWMTYAQIEKLKTKKVMFGDLQ